MENNIAIKNLNLNIGKKEISLTLEEARKLQDVLNDLFKEKEVVKEVHHHNHNRSWFQEYRPYFYQTVNDDPYRYFKVTCNSSSDNLGNNLSYMANLSQNTLKIEV